MGESILATSTGGGQKESSCHLKYVHTQLFVNMHIYLINPQTTVRGPMDPAQHSGSCNSETENDLAEIYCLG